MKENYASTERSQRLLTNQVSYLKGSLQSRCQSVFTVCGGDLAKIGIHISIVITLAWPGFFQKVIILFVVSDPE